MSMLSMYEHIYLHTNHPRSILNRVPLTNFGYFFVKDTGLGLTPIERGRLNVDLTRCSIVRLIVLPLPHTL